MKNSIYLFICLWLTACSNESTTPGPVSTVDSNLAEPGDTILPEMYLDNPIADTNYSIALDSSGAAILPGDTSYPKHY